MVTREGEIHSLIRDALATRGGLSTADIATETGLPMSRVDDALACLTRMQGSHLLVTESGVILYALSGDDLRERGFHLTRISRVIRQTGARVLRASMTSALLGYFALFSGLVAATLALSFGRIVWIPGTCPGQRRRRRFVYLPVHLIRQVTRLMSPHDNPLPSAVCSYVFGEPDPNDHWEVREQKTVLLFLRSHLGLMTVDELMVLTGGTPGGAQVLMDRLLRLHEGEPVVTPEGGVVYRFRRVLETSLACGPAFHSPVGLRRGMRVFSSNQRLTNRRLAALNLGNMAFGGLFLLRGMFLHGSLVGGTPDGGPLLTIVLGAAPAAFSLLFFLIPFFRRVREEAQNEQNRRRNLRQRIYQQVLSAPGRVRPEEITPRDDDERPKNFRKLIIRQLDALAARRGAEIAVDQNGRLEYRFPEIERDKREIADFRRRATLADYSLGRTVFDTRI